MEQKLSTAQKALEINVDLKKFGTFAEIGAGQEVARWYFHVGRASGTVAKSISAYDMAVSDSLYGATGHYVSRGRLEAMLSTEFTQLQSRQSCHAPQQRAVRVRGYGHHAVGDTPPAGTRMDGDSLSEQTWR